MAHTPRIAAVPRQALQTAPAGIATACPYCAVMVGDGLGKLSQVAGVQSQDLAELVAAHLVAKPESV